MSFLTFFVFSLSYFSYLPALDMRVAARDGSNFIIQVDENIPFLEVIEGIQAQLAELDIAQEMAGLYFNSLEASPELSFNYTIGIPEICVNKGKHKVLRNYSSPVSAEEKNNIRYVIRSLAKYNLAQLAREKSSLERAGDKINHLHPFRFLQCIFNDEELKAGLHAIRKKGGYVWSNYYDGMKSSLNEELDKDNLIQFTSDFADNVGVNVNEILPYVQARQWSNLVDVLINSIPRQGNPQRYDM
ncbi:hypothetical protein [Neochlamydia sp. AcF65]|uniref:hypothetical protein n=1 Tax=Neochlamydia sp. AcF65 TaxID=2795735 RepID=UPI001BC9E0D3|nr:hypothetical protein [Neochlamydia sp. AcF65]